MHIAPRNVVAVFVLLAALAPSERAFAADPTKAECIAASEDGQDLRRAGKLRDAREKSAVCVSASCPIAVREDCGERLREIEKATPSIVFDVKDATGNDLSAVIVTVDGEPLAKKLDGVALTVDPGEHTFAFEVEGLRNITKKFVIREGEKGRRERIRFGATGVKNPDVPASTDETPSRAPAIIAFGAGGVGLIIGIVSAGLYVNATDSAYAACMSPDAAKCASPAAQANATKFNPDQRAFSVGTGVGFVVAGVGAAVGTILLFTTNSGPAAKTSAERFRAHVGIGWAGFEGGF
jgi:hypothetical protein